MQVPEKLSLIGGSILLASTLIFTLKSQASHILPKVEHPINNIYGHAGDAQKSSEFDDNYRNAQKDGWKGGQPTGHWGTSKYYIDKDKNMHIGQGILQGSIVNNLGWDMAGQVRTINIDQPVQLSNDSSYLFANAKNVEQMNGMDNVDASKAGNFFAMFQSDTSLKSLDLGGWNVGNLGTDYAMFQDDTSLQSINVDWQNANNISNIGWAFQNDTSLTNLDLSSWHSYPTVAHDHITGNDKSLKSLNISGLDTSSSRWDDYVFGGYNDTSIDNIQNLTLGNKSIIQGKEKLPNVKWSNGSQQLSTSQLTDGKSHPGTWSRQ